MTYKIEDIIAALNISKGIMERKNSDNIFVKENIEFLNRLLEIKNYLNKELKEEQVDYKKIVENISMIIK